MLDGRRVLESAGLSWLVVYEPTGSSPARRRRTGFQGSSEEAPLDSRSGNFSNDLLADARNLIAVPGEDVNGEMRGSKGATKGLRLGSELSAIIPAKGTRSTSHDVDRFSMPVAPARRPTFTARARRIRVERSCTQPRFRCRNRSIPPTHSTNRPLAERSYLCC